MVPSQTKVDANSPTNAALPSPSLPPLPLATGDGTQRIIDPPRSATLLPNPNAAQFIASKTNEPSTNNLVLSKCPTDSVDTFDPPTSLPGFVNPSLRQKDDSTSSNDPGYVEAPNGPAIGLGSMKQPEDIQPAGSPGRAANPPASNTFAINPHNSKKPLSDPPPAVAIQSHILTDGAAPIKIDGKSIFYQAGSIRVGSEVQHVEAVPTPAPNYPKSKLGAGPDIDMPSSNPRPAVLPEVSSGSSPDPQPPAPAPHDPGHKPAGSATAPRPVLQNAPARPVPAPGPSFPPNPPPDPAIAPRPDHPSKPAADLVPDPADAQADPAADHTDAPASQAAKPLAPIAVDKAQETPDPSPVVVGGLTFTALRSIAKAKLDPLPISRPVTQVAANHDPPDIGLDSVAHITVGSRTIGIGPNAINGAGTTLQQDDPGMTVDGIPISFGSSVFVVGTRTADLAPAALHAAITAQPQQAHIVLGDKIINVDRNAIDIDGVTLEPADPGIAISGTLVSLTSSSILIIGTHSQSLAFSEVSFTAVPSYINVGGEAVSIGANNIIVAGSTLAPGTPPATIDNDLVSLGNSILVVGTQTTSFLLPGTKTRQSLISIAGHTITAAAGSIIIAGATLTPGAPAITADGTPISLGSSILVVGTQKASLTLPSALRSVDPSGGNGTGAVIHSDLSEIGGGTVPPPVQTGQSNSRTADDNAKNTVPSTSGAERRSVPQRWWNTWDSIGIRLKFGFLSLWAFSLGVDVLEIMLL